MAESGHPLVDLRGQRDLVVGLANEHTIAAGRATSFVAAAASWKET